MTDTKSQISAETLQKIVAEYGKMPLEKLAEITQISRREIVLLAMHLRKAGAKIGSYRNRAGSLGQIIKNFKEKNPDSFGDLK